MKRIFFMLFCLMSFSFSMWSQEYKLSDEEYFVKYTTMLNHTQKRLTYMNKKNALAKVGTETIDGLISGTLFYDVKIKGMGGVVTLRYTNYCDEEGWVFNGEIITKSNMSQNGTLSGKVIISGDFPGTIYYDNVILKDGKPGDGTYGVEQNDSNREEVSYTYFFKAEN